MFMAPVLQMNALAAAEEGVRASREPSPGPSPASRGPARAGLLQDVPLALEAFEHLEGSPAVDRGPLDSAAPTAMGAFSHILAFHDQTSFQSYNYGHGIKHQTMWVWHPSHDV